MFILRYSANGALVTDMIQQTSFDIDNTIWITFDDKFFAPQLKFRITLVSADYAVEQGKK